MGQLTGNNIANTYQGLIKLANSTTGVTNTTQSLQDGLGNNLPIAVSTGSVSISGSFNIIGNESITGSLHQSGTFYPDVIDWFSSSIQQGTGSYILTTDANGVTQYDTYTNVANKLIPDLTGSFLPFQWDGTYYSTTSSISLNTGSNSEYFLHQYVLETTPHNPSNFVNNGGTLNGSPNLRLVANGVSGSGGNIFLKPFASIGGKVIASGSLNLSGSITATNGIFVTGSVEVRDGNLKMVNSNIIYGTGSIFNIGGEAINAGGNITLREDIVTITSPNGELSIGSLNNMNHGTASGSIVYSTPNGQTSFFSSNGIIVANVDNSANTNISVAPTTGGTTNISSTNGINFNAGSSGIAGNGPMYFQGKNFGFSSGSLGVSYVFGEDPGPNPYIHWDFASPNTVIQSRDVAWITNYGGTGSFQINSGKDISLTASGSVGSGQVNISGSNRVNIDGPLFINGVAYTTGSGTAGTAGTSGTSGTSGAAGSSGTSGDSIFAQTGSIWATTNNLQISGSINTIYSTVGGTKAHTVTSLNKGNTYIGYTSDNQDLSYVTASNGGNLIFGPLYSANQNIQSGSYIITGSNNIVMKGKNLVSSGFYNSINGTNNIIQHNGNGVLVNTSNTIIPNVNNNLVNNAVIQLQGSGSSQNVANNITAGGGQITLTHPSGGFNFNSNIFAGQNFLISNANTTILLGSQPAITGNHFMGSITLNHISSSLTYDRNITLGFGMQVDNLVSSSLAQNIQRNILMSDTYIYLSGSNLSTQKQIVNNIIGGAGIQVSSSLAGTNATNLGNSIVYGQQLFVRPNSDNTGGTVRYGGSAFFGRNNDTGSLANSQDIVFAVGTGPTSGSRRTGFWIDSGSVSNVSGSLNVIGNTTMTGSLNISGSQIITGSIRISQNNQIFLPSGSNQQIGLAVLDGANPGTVTVSNSLVSATSIILLTKQTLTNSHMVAISSKGAGTFTITSNGNGDTDTVAYQIINPS